ncbi:MAG: mechanosensitive ion channel [Flavobacteriaceae bacterium]|nr:MAG: mechanosensitive ion channel [Flavobacteriaceae bacterium]
MEKLKEFLNYSFKVGENAHINVKTILILIVILFLTSWLLKLVRRVVNNKLDEDNKGKFKSVFSFLKYFIYILVLIVALESSGVKLSVILAGSAALLVGIGLGLQTLFQDIISGIFILVDKSLQVNDVVEIDGKIGRIFEIKLRTSRAVTIDDRVVIIPNHKFMTQSLYNWTQNGNKTVESVEVGVAYGTDVQKVKEILLKIAVEHPMILKDNRTDVLFDNFGDSALIFNLRFVIKNSFIRYKVRSDIRFAIDKAFKEYGIQIPFPQRDVHIFNPKN